MNNEQKPCGSNVWKLILGISLCSLCLVVCVLLLMVNAFLALIVGIAMLVGGIILLVSYSNNKTSTASKNKAMNQQMQVYQSLTNQIQESERQMQSIQREIDRLIQERDALAQESFVRDVFPSEIPEGTSDEIKNQLVLLRQKESNMVKNGAAIKAAPGLTAKVLSEQSKQLLRCFGAECDVIIDKVTLKNTDASRDKIVRSFDTLNRIFAIDGVQLDTLFLQCKLDELNCAHAVLVKLEEEKEQRRAIREQMVEEEKVRKEIEREKQKIEKEEAQFSGEIKKLLAYMQKARDEVERNLYLDKIDELQKKLDALQKDKDNVLQREQNTRAGFVYIISNIGSFGEQVFKIGMTRRLEPMDRISELSSASVPFPFDVHALIFSDDAPALETILHQHFDAQRVNRVNLRKEFFRVDLDEIKKVILENHNATVQFVETPDAVEYRETLKLQENG